MMFLIVIHPYDVTSLKCYMTILKIYVLDTPLSRKRTKIKANE
ncbi:hypothetical protein [Nonlabens sp. SCSIO 43208]